MLEARVRSSQTLRLSRMLKGNAKKLRRQLSIAVNATAKKTVSIVSKQIREHVAVTAKGVKQTTKVVARANAHKILATVRLSKTRRPSLKEFGARQTRAGVTYRISKRGGRQTIPGGFQGPKPGTMSVRLKGHVFKRVGKKRLPIVKLHGPSPWAVYKKQRLHLPTKRQTRRELRKQVQRRIHFLRHKARTS